MSATRAPIRLLLVDDELDFLDSTSRALSRRGFDVQGASDAESALDLLEEGSFDAAVLDIKMPGMDGVELFGEMQRRWPTIPVVLLTGHANLQQAFETSKRGIVDYLAKPCETERLAEICRAAVMAARKEAKVEKDEEPQGPIRVLIVDDEQDLLDSVSKVLARRDMLPTTAPNGEEAIALIERNVFDVVILDLRMPGMNGLEVLRRIKQIQPLVELVLLTGHPSIASAMEGIRAGAFDYLVKPPDMNGLVAKIRKAHEKKLANVEREKDRVVEEIRRNRPD